MIGNPNLPVKSQVRFSDPTLTAGFRRRWGVVHQFTYPSLEVLGALHVFELLFAVLVFLCQMKAGI